MIGTFIWIMSVDQGGRGERTRRWIATAIAITTANEIIVVGVWHQCSRPCHLFLLRRRDEEVHVKVWRRRVQSSTWCSTQWIVIFVPTLIVIIMGCYSVAFPTISRWSADSLRGIFNYCWDSAASNISLNFPNTLPRIIGLVPARSMLSSRVLISPLLVCHKRRSEHELLV